MEIFLDSADLNEIARWMDHGMVDGVTTNPSVLLKDGGYDFEARTREIASLVHPRPVSIEVFTNDREEMEIQAREFARWGTNVVVKIPVLNEHGDPCLGTVKTLSEEGINVNMTACLSFGQVMAGAKVGAVYCSIFAGRVADEGHDATKLIRDSVDWLARWKYPTKIIVGSVREAINLQDAALAGAHVLTTPPNMLAKWIDHQYTRATVAGFNRDAQAALAKVRESDVPAST